MTAGALVFCSKWAKFLHQGFPTCLGHTEVKSNCRQGACTCVALGTGEEAIRISLRMT